MDTVEATWNRIKFELTNKDVWAEDEDVHLTCLPTMYGFSGRQQLSQFIQSPFLSTHLLKRFNNNARTLSLAISSANDSDNNKATAVVMEEDLVTLLHHEGMEWLLPRVSAIRAELTFILNISAILVNGPSGWRLKSVRMNWDHASLLAQSGALLESLKTAARKSASPEEILLDSLKCADGKKLKVRLEYPHPNNITTFQQSEQQEQICIKRNPINERTELSMEVEAPMGQVSPVRKHPAMTSEFFSSPEPATAAIPSAKPHPALQSKVTLGTNFTPVALEKRPNPASKNIFFSDSPAPMIKPSIVIDSKRLESRIVAPEEDKPIVPNVPSLDENRFRSTWSESDMSEDSPLPVKTSTRILNPKRFESHIFSPEQVNPIQPSAALHQNVQQQKGNEMLLGQGEVDEEVKFNVKMDPRRFQSSFSFSETTPKAQSNNNYNNEAQHFEQQQSNFQIGTYDSPSVMVQKREHAKQAVTSRAYSSHKSTLAFDFDDPLPSPPKQPSTRVLAPPGGHSNMPF